MSDTTMVDGISTDNRETVEDKDNELENLLSDALKDFGNSMQMPQKPFNRSSDLLNASTDQISIEPSMLENLWNEPTMKEAMSRFESSIRSVFNTSSTVSESATSVVTESEKIIEKSCNNNNNNTNSNIGNVDIDSLIDDFRKMAKMTAETFSKDSDDDSKVRQAENLFLAEEFSRGFMEVAQKLSTTVLKNEIPNNDEEEDNGFHNMVSQTIRSLSDNTKDLEDGGFNLNDCSEHLGRLLKGIENNENVNKNFYKFMKICMKTIKLVVYPSLKDLCEKYPSYIEKNKLKLTESGLTNCKNQYQVMEKICKVFETEGINDSEKLDTDYENDDSLDDIDSDKTDKLYKKFLNILNIMKEIQECGQIPEELVEKESKFYDTASCNLSKTENCVGRNCSIS